MINMKWICLESNNVLLTLCGLFYGVLCIFSIVTGIMYFLFNVDSGYFTGNHPGLARYRILAWGFFSSGCTGRDTGCLPPSLLRLWQPRMEKAYAADSWLQQYGKFWIPHADRCHLHYEWRLFPELQRGIPPYAQSLPESLAFIGYSLLDHWLFCPVML